MVECDGEQRRDRNGNDKKQEMSMDKKEVMVII